MVSPFGELELRRTSVGGLQAWDGADRLLLDLVHEQTRVADDVPIRILIIGDNFGALSLALAKWSPIGWTDSAMSVRSIAENGLRNNVSVAEPKPIGAFPIPTEFAKQFDLVVWRIPRTTAYLQQQTAFLQYVIDDATLVVAAGLDKYLPPTTRDVLSQLGEVSTLPGAFKAHAFVVHPNAPSDHVPIPFPITPRTEVPEFGLDLLSGPNVFSSERLDLGTRVMLSAFDKLPNVSTVADLGCGNGVLGLAAMRALPHADVAFFDESSDAVAASEDNAEHVSGQGALSFYWSDGMHAYDGPLFDLVLCNPPFHQAGAVGDDLAWGMFQDAKTHLATDGELWVVGNRHLAYHIKLKRIFGNCDQLAAHPKFVVLRSVKRPARPTFSR
jgi:23S rRNA (guanine1835-N2)-methyltransferase